MTVGSKLLTKYQGHEIECAATGRKPWDPITFVLGLSDNLKLAMDDYKVVLR